MDNFIDDPVRREFIEEWVDDWEKAVNDDIEYGIPLPVALNMQTDEMLSLITIMTHKGIHQGNDDEALAQSLNENLALIQEWNQRIIDKFNLDPMTWKGVNAGMQTMYIAMVKQELHHIRDTKAVQWRGERFTTV